ncbi:MAG: hypothetical protein ACI3YK_00550 [Eubacteriales bacterium]
MKVLKFLNTLLPHVMIVISLMMLTFSIVNKINTSMAFINHYMTKNLMVVFCVVTLTMTAVLTARLIVSRKFPLMILPVLAIILTVGLSMVLFYDYTFPRAILFTKASVENLIIAQSVAALLNGIVMSVLNRIAAKRRWQRELKRHGNE